MAHRINLLARYCMAFLTSTAIMIITNHGNTVNSLSCASTAHSNLIFQETNLGTLEPWKGRLWERFTITSHDIGSNKREKKWNKISRKENQHQTRSQRKIGTLERFGICLLPLRSLVKCTTICQAISSRLLVAIGIIVLVRSPNLIS